MGKVAIFGILMLELNRKSLHFHLVIKNIALILIFSVGHRKRPGHYPFVI